MNTKQNGRIQNSTFKKSIGFLYANNKIVKKDWEKKTSFMAVSASEIVRGPCQSDKL